MARLDEAHPCSRCRPHGCFSECRIYKVIDSDAADPSYVMQYHCRSLEEYHRYRDNFAAALQKEHSDKFAGRFRGARQLLEEVASGDN